MYARILRTIPAAAALLASAVMANPTVYPTGTTIHDPAKAWHGYVVFADPNGVTHVIDPAGNEVHRWDKAGFPSEVIDPSLTGGKKGQLLVQLENGKGRFGGIFENRVIGELDWAGNVAWRWAGNSPEGARQNHDWARLKNGNTLIIATRTRTIPPISAKPIADQVVQEIAPDGKVVWEWQVADHLDEFGFSPEGLAQLRSELAGGDAGHGFLTINDLAPIGSNKWFDAGDQRFHPDNFVIDSRIGSFIAIVDRSTGKIAWRIGPDWPTQSSPVQRPILSSAVPRPVDQTSGQHDAHIIPKGLPGAGNLLVFDNEGPSGFPPTRLSMFQGSRILEIDPVSKEVVWQYTGVDSDAPSWSFNSSFISSARRLPNGNTLIDEGMNGRIFQVTREGEIVWEYINPFFGRQVLGEGREVRTNWVFRAQPVPYDWLPEGTPRSEAAVARPDNAGFRVAGAAK